MQCAIARGSSLRVRRQLDQMEMGVQSSVVCKPFCSTCISFGVILPSWIADTILYCVIAGVYIYIERVCISTLLFQRLCSCWGPLYWQPFEQMPTHWRVWTDSSSAHACQDSSPPCTKKTILVCIYIYIYKLYIYTIETLKNKQGSIKFLEMYIYIYIY